jgi:hypothetical protein
MMQPTFEGQKNGRITSFLESMILERGCLTLRIEDYINILLIKDDELSS